MMLNIILYRLLCSLLVLISPSEAWRLTLQIDGHNWEQHFGSEQIAVNSEYTNYVNLGEAKSRGLVYRDGDSFVVRPDFTNVVPNGARGRDSIRLRSNARFDYGLFIFDIDRMPAQQCGLWTAFFLLGTNWPQDGEIDVIEGVNFMQSNQITLHSKPGCNPGVGPWGERGQRIGNADCGAGGGFTGCATLHNAPNGFGNGFNAAGGGIYATQWTKDGGVQVWHWPRNAAPRDVWSNDPNPYGWGMPVANWGAGCDYPGMFHNLQIVILNTFCGDWAGNNWIRDGCGNRAPTCQQFVQRDPRAFSDSFWKIRSIRAFQ